MSEFIQNILDLRTKELCLSKGQLARLFQVHHSVVSRIESGSGSIIRFAECLNKIGYVILIYSDKDTYVFEYKNAHEQLKSLREQNGVSRRCLCRILKKDKWTVSRMERNKSDLWISIAECYLTGLGYKLKLGKKESNRMYCVEEL